MYRVLYRKWRPQTFDDVVGQDAVTKTLKNEIEQNRLTHAYLFVGSRGTGKTSCAKILAKAANCLHPVNGNPCNQCEICRGIDDESNMDVVEIDAASNNGVNEIRDLRQKTTYLPSKSKYRVYIIDEVHMLTLPAFNALLKTLEEPPAHIIFILATTELHKLPATITSRCQRFDFKRIATDDISKRLKYVSSQEGFNITDEACDLIASLADGGMRDALSILDKVSSVTDQIDEDAVISTAGLIGNQDIFSLFEAIQKGDSTAGILSLNSLYSGARDFRRICEDLIMHYRNLMLIKTCKDARGLIICPEKDFSALTDYAKSTSLDDIIYKINELSELMLRMGRSTSPRCDFEVEIVKLATRPHGEQATSSAKADVKPQPPKPTKKDDNKEQSAPVDDKSANEKPDEKPQEKPQKSDVQPSEHKDLFSGYEKLNKWPVVLANLEASDKMLYAILADSQGYLDGNRVLVDSPNKMFPDLIKRENNALKLKKAVNETLQGNFSIAIYKKPKTTPKNDPLDDIAGALMDAGIDTTIN